MKLYYSPGACSLAPHIALQEAGLKHELVRVDLRQKTYAGGDFKKVNPKGSVPVIETDDGQILTEAAVIQQYIADQKPESGLMPKAGTWERYRAQEWLNFVATELHKGFGPLWHKEVGEAAQKIAWETLTKKFDFISERLEGGFLMGSKFMVADGYLFTVLNWTHMLKKDLAPWPKIQDFMTRVAARPAVQAALKAEGLVK